MNRQSVLITARRHAELVSEPVDPASFNDEAVGGKTLCTLISTGTEIAGFYDRENAQYPLRVGYACVFQLDYVGKNVPGLKAGDMVFSCSRHASYQVEDYRHVIKLPEGLKPQHALFARISGVTMVTLSQTAVRPGETVLIAGLGTVGFLALQVYANCGYRVVGVEPSAERAAFLQKNYPEYDIRSEYPSEAELCGRTGLALECSGSQQGALACIKQLRKHGELAIIGVPWKKTSDMSACEILRAIFDGSVRVMSGFEMQMPRFERNEAWQVCQFDNFAQSMDWMKNKRMSVDGLYKERSFEEAGRIYDELYNKTENSMSVVLDWTGANI